MRLTLKLNLGSDTYENLELQTNEYEYIEDCYREQVIFLQGWVEFTPFAQPLLDHILRLLGGEKTVLEKITLPSERTGDAKEMINPTDSKPLEKTTMTETQNFVDVRECRDYSDKAYKLIGYDNLEAYIAKQHVIRIESIEGGATRVIVGVKSAWVITKLEWK